MYNFFPKGMPVITVVVLGTDKSGNVVQVNRFRLAKSQVDMAKRFALQSDGEPVIGPRVYRERTKKELAQGLAHIESLCNCGAPWFPPQQRVGDHQ